MKNGNELHVQKNITRQNVNFVERTKRRFMATLQLSGMCRNSVRPYGTVHICVNRYCMWSEGNTIYHSMELDFYKSDYVAQNLKEIVPLKKIRFLMNFT